MQSLVGWSDHFIEGRASVGSFESSDMPAHLPRPTCYGGQLRLDGGIRCTHGASVGVDTQSSRLEGLQQIVRSELGDAVQ